MTEEAQLEDFTEGVHLETADGPKPIVDWGTPGAPDPIQTDEPSEVVDDSTPPEPVVYNYDDGSTVTIEQPELTGRGWRATADSGTGKPAEVFYGKTKDELLQNVLVGKLNATRKINELKRKALLDAPVNDPSPVSDPEPQTQPTRLSANDVFDLKAKLEENPDLANELWFQKRTGMTPEQLTSVLQSLQNKTEDAQSASEDTAIAQILIDWRDTSDYVNDDRNRDAIIAWLLKFKARVSPARFNVEGGLSHLYQNGHLTNENLDEAWDDLKEEGQAFLNAPAPAPVAVNPGNRRPRNAGFNIRSNGGTVATRTPQVPEKITQAELDKMSDEEIKNLYHGILEMNRTPAGKRAISDAVERIREKRQ